MKTKIINGVVAVTALLASAIPVSAIAASASVTLSNINITAHSLGGAVSLDSIENSRNIIWIISETIGDWSLPNSIQDDLDFKSHSYNDEYYPGTKSLSSSASIYGASASGFLTLDHSLIFFNGTADASLGEYRSSVTSAQSYIYFRSSGPVEFDVSADYSFASDPGDNSRFGGSNAYVKLTANINGIPNLFGNKEMNLLSSTDPGLHTETGDFSFKFITPNQPIDGYLVMDSGAIAWQIPEPQTYAMLLVGLGLIGFSLKRRENSSRLNA